MQQKKISIIKIDIKLFHIKYHVFNQFTHYLYLSLCIMISSLNKLNCDLKIINKVTTGIRVQSTFRPAT
jgi:hypothetical protein